LKYKQHEGSGSYELVGGNLLESVLRNRGIEEWEKFLKVSEKDIFDAKLLKNIDEGCLLLKRHLGANNKTYIEIDSDSDGNCSSAIIISFIQDIAPNSDIVYSIKEGKEHGIQLKNIDTDIVKLVIVPDGGTNDTEESKQLAELGIDVLILDHHQFERDNPHATIINCMDGQYPNTNLSGTNVVYKFIEHYCKMFKIDYDCTKFLDLVALGNIADSMDLRSLESRQYTLMGLKLMEEDKERMEKNLPIKGNKFIQAVVDKKKERDLKHINITSVGWKIAPVINGTIRFGTQEEKMDLFKAILGVAETREYQPRRKCKTDPKPDIVQVSLQEDMVRVATNAKARQDKVVKENKEKLIAKITEKNLNDNKILMVDGTDILENKTLTGLVANKLASEYKKPVLIFKRMNDKIYGGSARNYNLSPIEDLRSFINELGAFEDCLGHAGAFGIQIKKENMVEARDLINEKLKDVVMEDVYIVDYIIPIGRINKQDIIQVGKWREIWGNSVHKPLFALTNLVMDVGEINLVGDKRNILSFKKNDISFIKFYANEDLLSEITMRKKDGFGKAVKQVRLDIIGEFEVNNYENRDYPQINIIDFNVEEIKELLF